MNDDEIRDDLRGIHMPPDLVPPEGFADGALHGRRVSRARRTVLAGTLAVALGAAIPVALVNANGPGDTDYAGPAASSSSSPVSEVAAPRPGGGPWVVGAFRNVQAQGDGTNNYTFALLDLRTGEYKEVSQPVMPSPDGTKVLIGGMGTGMGIADREEYLDHGEAAVTWLEGFRANNYEGRTLTADGSAIVGEGEVEMDPDDMTSAPGPMVRYDIATGAKTTTPVPAEVNGAKVVKVVLSADDSGYLMMLESDAGRTYLASLALDGTVGDPVEMDVEPTWETFINFTSPVSPYVVVTAAEVDGGPDADTTFIIDPATGETVLEYVQASDYHLLGWYDDHTLVQMDGDDLELFDVHEDRVTRTIEWPKGTLLPQMESSEGLPASAADLGF